MRVTRLESHVSLIDVQTGGLGNFIASYVLKGKKAAIIETGPTSSVPNLLEGLKETSVKREDVAFVAVTHIHLDHSGGVGTLIKSLPNAQVIAHPVAALHLVNPEKLWQQSIEVQGKVIADLYHAPEPVPAERLMKISDGMVLDLGDDVKLKVVETLGHASHHQSYYETHAGGLFPGDAAGIYVGSLNVVIPTTPPPFRLDIALESLEKLLSLRPKTLYYSHFGRAGEASKKLKDYAEQLKLWASIAEKGLQQGKDFNAVREEILERDPSINRVAGLVRNHPVLSNTVLHNSVRGVVKFVEKYGRSFTK